MERANFRPDIQRALARSREARAARRRRRRGFILLACASILVGGGTAFSIAGFDAGDAVEAAVSNANTFAQLLSQRSPGSRTSAELTKTKRAQRALPKVRVAAPVTNKVEPLVPAAVELAQVLLPPPVPGELTPPVAMIDAGSPPTLGGIVGPPGSSFPSPGGGVNLTPPGGTPPPPGGDATTVPPGGSDDTPGETVNPPTANPPVSFPKDEPRETLPVTPLPEPGTWATMLLGFGLIGWQLRRQSKRTAEALPA
jgi:hypothetical protein